MPTYRHLPTGKRFLFAYIPRTGGRFFEENLKHNDCIVEQDNLWKSVEGIEVAHFHRELYEKYLDVKGIPHITIVRNPIDRFFSASIYLKRMYGPDIQESAEDRLQFFSMLENFPFSEAVNWYRPQIDFLSKETQIWRYEDALGSKFENWLSEVLGISFHVDAFVDYVTYPDEGWNKLERSAKLLHNVGNLYRKDIEQLYSQHT